MSRNPYFNNNYSNHWHGDEMFESDGRDASVADTWFVWETGNEDCDGWGRKEWIDDMRRGDFFNDLPDAAYAEILKLIAENRGSEQFKSLAKYAHDYIDATLEL